MKKRSLGIVLSLVMTLAMGLTALAAPSKEVAGIIDKVEVVDTVNKGVEIIVSEPSKNVEETIVADVKKPETIKAVLGSAYTAKLSVLDVLNVSLKGDVDQVQWPITLKLSIAGVNKNTSMYVLAYVDGSWKKVEIVEMGSGYVTVKLNELSTLAFVADKDTLSIKSPSTGETVMTTAVAMMVAVAAVGMFVLKRKATV